MIDRRVRQLIPYVAPPAPFIGSIKRTLFAAFAIVGIAIGVAYAAAVGTDRVEQYATARGCQTLGADWAECR